MILPVECRNVIDRHIYFIDKKFTRISATEDRFIFITWLVQYLWFFKTTGGVSVPRDKKNRMAIKAYVVVKLFMNNLADFRLAQDCPPKKLSGYKEAIINQVLIKALTLESESLVRRDIIT